MIKSSLLQLENELSDRFGNLTTGEGNKANPRELYAAFKSTGLIAENAERYGLILAKFFVIYDVTVSHGGTYDTSFD